MAKQIRDIKDAQKFMDTREGILTEMSRIKDEMNTIKAETSMIRTLLWKVWEESHGSIEKSDWKSLKKEVLKKMRK